jgi:hypothetical protein
VMDLSPKTDDSVAGKSVFKTVICSHKTKARATMHGPESVSRN